MNPNKVDQSASISDGGSDEDIIINVTPIRLCELCDEEPISVKFLPCGHAVLCKLCAIRAVKCLECKVSHSTANLTKL